MSSCPKLLPCKKGPTPRSLRRRIGSRFVNAGTHIRAEPPQCSPGALTRSLVHSPHNRESKSLWRRRGFLTAIFVMVVLVASLSPPQLRAAAPAGSQGAKRLLFMRVAFPDDPTEPISQSAAVTLMGQANSWYAAHSYGTTSFTTAVTPLLILPQTKTWYSQHSLNALRSDALIAALAAGFDSANFDLDIVRNNSLPGSSFSGTSNVGEKGLWLQSSSLGVVVHELGHNYGLDHANLWAAIGDSIIGPGNNHEYGNVFDTMGLPQADPTNFHFNVIWKNRLNWLPDSFVQNVSTSGVYRLRAFDVSELQSGGFYALRIQKDDARDYWAEFRQSFASNPRTQNGILLNWGPWSRSTRGTQLIDTTPGSSLGTDDAPLMLGRTFVDSDAGLFITPVALGANGTNRWIDVQLNLGSFPTNQPPTVSIVATATNVVAGVPLNFQAIATDPNGDDLAYSWEFGDDGLGTNGPAVSHTWSGIGEYVVRCRVSDMKGGADSQSVIVIVGSPTTYRISGHVTKGGSPVENVRISVSSSQMTYTDSQGNYSLVGLGVGTYTANATLSGYTFSNSPSANPVSLGPSSGTIDFFASPNPALIYLPPLNQTVNAGTNALFTVVASGASPLNYQWLRNGSPILGATGSSYLRTNVKTTDVGSYSVAVTNSAGSVTSIVATLTVIDEPIITTQPQDRLVNIGSTATFSVTASGGVPLSYQWIHGFDPIAEGTNNSLTVTNVQDADAGLYFVLVFNASGFTQSIPVQLTVNHLPNAAPPSLQRLSKHGVKMKVGRFLGTDSDGDLVSLLSAGPGSANGGIINTNGTWVFYNPPTGPANSDTFPFTVSDGRGGFAAGTATVTLKADTDTSQNLRTESLENGSVRLIFDGIPNHTYSVQFTENLLTPQWLQLTTVAANDSGTLIHVDSPIGPSLPRFYRISEP